MAALPARRCLVTSIVRYAGQERNSGFLRLVDLETGRVLVKTAVPESAHRAHDPNPRGGLRGARGISVWRDRLVIANSERLLVFDPDWRILNDISHRWMGGVHDILAEEAGIWVTCTSADLLIQVDWQGRIIGEWEWRQDTALVEQLALGRIGAVDRQLDYRDPESMRDGVRNTVHLNGVNRGSDGLLLSFGRILSPARYRQARMQSLVGKFAKTAGLKRRHPRPSGQALPQVPVSQIEGSRAALVSLSDAGQARLLHLVDGLKVPNHNIIESGDRLVYNDSNNGRLVGLDKNGRLPALSAAIPGQPSFARGLAQLDADHFLVGSQAPAALYRVNLAADAVTQTILLNGEENETVYAVALLPDSFGTPGDNKLWR